MHELGIEFETPPGMGAVDQRRRLMLRPRYDASSVFAVRFTFGETLAKIDSESITAGESPESIVYAESRIVII